MLEIAPKSIPTQIATAPVSINPQHNELVKGWLAEKESQYDKI